MRSMCWPPRPRASSSSAPWHSAQIEHGLHQSPSYRAALLHSRVVTIDRCRCKEEDSQQRECLGVTFLCMYVRRQLRTRKVSFKEAHQSSRSCCRALAVRKCAKCVSYAAPLRQPRRENQFINWRWCRIKVVGRAHPFFLTAKYFLNFFLLFIFNGRSVIVNNILQKPPSNCRCKLYSLIFIVYRL